jgi:hypothetical protein
MVLAAITIICGWLGPGEARAADGLVVTSTAVYDVRPADGIAVVTVNVAATNVTPDTATERFYYTGVSLPIHATATSVTATAAGSVLPVSLSPADEFATFADVTFGAEVFHRQTYRFTLTYILEDAGGDPGRETWIRSRFVTLPIWAFGSPDAAGVRVEVALPEGFEPTVTYGEMEIVASAGGARVVAEGVDPATFGAQVSAERAGERARQEATAQVSRGSVRLLFHAWPDDPEWTKRQSDVLTRGLPVLEDAIGLPYPIPGTLHVSEHAYQHLGAYAGFFRSGIDSIEMRFDADAFTALHEAAHVWFNHELAEERWLIEGFASYYAEVAGRSLDEQLEMSDLTDANREAAFQLTEWDPNGEVDLAREDYGYAASHELARKVAELAGADALQEVWRLADAEALVYGRHPAETGPERVPNPDDWRRFLDLLEEASDADFDPLWRDWLLSGSQRRDLAPRDAARKAFERTEAALGDWLMPATTRRHMEAWDFDRAHQDLDRLDDLVEEHGSMVARADALSLAPSGEVGELLAAGIAESEAELEGQEAALDAIEEATPVVSREPELIERIGLLGQEEPAAHLDWARDAFESGDEEAVLRDSAAARDLVAGAEATGRQRVATAGAAILAADLLAMVGLLVRRRRLRTRPIG